MTSSLPSKPSVVYADSSEFSSATEEVLTEMGVNVNKVTSNHLVEDFLQKNPDTSAVIMRNNSYGPPENMGLNIATHLIQNTSFKGPVIILTGYLHRSMSNMIPEEYRQTARIEIFDSILEPYASFLYIALRAKYPKETEGFGKNDLVKILGFSEDERTELPDLADHEEYYQSTLDLVLEISQQHGSDEAYGMILAKINQLKTNKEGGLNHKER
ncbi:MAG: hypothetical protein UV73_C0013G0017 [Candidatus Gottesmanbacteria bacterium GW2011_GWA2_43_14]|uniref:Response regulatory domain-containing protein n=1 Tax=Candidatus Gottesmanbacteria bacterium GW2011_GWA2_43_14 TaxID=1618443 RepID=A0A0G1DE26_9BACT|nr:MAG: hypothetical protein UV73_C0013G0017 [Candidatus Gottesmanbacteria bacterium GW2011_GWA2_43_14]